MRNAWVVFLVVSLGARVVAAAPPEYSSDPFGDDDFIDPPLILDVAHPTAPL